MQASVETNAVTLVSAHTTDEVGLQSKEGVAGRILDRVEPLLSTLPASASAR
jgi:hypothetical protein